MYGAFSIQSFVDQAGLSHTHEDAQGWLNYVKQFTPPNFWYKDGSVGVWAYYETYDDWQDTYGMDAVVAAYHSGHGGMDANGVFYAPMGTNWSGLGTSAVSSSMLLGNEHVKYLFWSTCVSCRVLDGQSPLRTWSGSNLGFRMLFGFETTSYDDPNYGKYFWEEWNKAKSFSAAWLDASWRIAHDQAPSVAAVGATADEAKDRVFNERYFYHDAASRSWWWWRWYYAAKAARETNRALPLSMLIARLEPVRAREVTARGLADAFQLEMRLPDDVPSAADGSFVAAEGDQRIVRAPDGSIEVRLARPNLSNLEPLPVGRARSIAQGAVRRYALSDQTPLIFDRVALAQEAGATASGSGEVRGPYTTSTIVQFRQVINGLPVITPGAGTVRIAIDNDGQVTDVISSVRNVASLSDRPRVMAPVPPALAPAATDMRAEPVPFAPLDGESLRYEEALASAFSQRLAAWAMSGRMPIEFTTVPGSTEIGYDIQGEEAVLVAQKSIEVNFGGGIRKLYRVVLPLFS
jgi:hypothetical protein